MGIAATIAKIDPIFGINLKRRSVLPVKVQPQL